MLIAFHSNLCKFILNVLRFEIHLLNNNKFDFVTFYAEL